MVTSLLARMSGSAPLITTLPPTSSASADSAMGVKASSASVGALTPPREILPRSSSLPVVSTLTVGLAAPTKVCTSIGISAFRP